MIHHQGTKTPRELLASLAKPDGQMNADEGGLGREESWTKEANWSGDGK